MSLPQELLELCLKEFPTFELAVDANPSKQDRILFAVHESFPTFTVRDVSDYDQMPTSISFETRKISIQRLPSGYFGWIPDHPDDFAQVQEQRHGSNMQFGATLALYCYWKLGEEEIHRAKLMNKDIFTEVKGRLQRQVFNDFACHVGTGKNYRISLAFKDGYTSDFGIKTLIIQAVLFFAEEIV